MAERPHYKTKQKACVLDFFLRHREDSYSARELIDSSEVTVGSATVYRTLSGLCDSGEIEKIFLPGDDGARYRLSRSGECTHAHCRMKCVDCGKTVSLSCGCLEQMRSHFEDEHGFSILEERVILYGRCSACRSRGDCK